jgi:hypothetical protein
MISSGEWSRLRGFGYMILGGTQQGSLVLITSKVIGKKHQMEAWLLKQP